MSNYEEATLGFVQGTKGVLSAADMLKTAAAGGDPGDIEFAAQLLAKAADDYTGNTAQYERFGLDELALTPDTDLPRRERMASDILASALVDLEVGSTLIVAGQVAGETDEPGTVEDLDTATNQLRYVADAVSLPMGRDPRAPVTHARFGLDEVAAPAPFAASADVATAKASYEKHVTEVLESLVEETEKVFKIAFQGIVDLDDEDVAAAIASLGETVGVLPKVGKLVTKGLQLAAQALEKLTSLIGKDNLDALKKKASEIIEKVKQGGEPLAKFLNYSYGVENAKLQIEGRLARTTADAAAIDSGTKKLADLQARFAEQMAMLTRIAKTLNTSKKLVSKLLPDVAAVVLFGSFYLVAMDYAVLAGMDYADTTTLITFVEGILKISEATLG
jgi:hypothetical protein